MASRIKRRPKPMKMEEIEEPVVEPLLTREEELILARLVCVSKDAQAKLSSMEPLSIEERGVLEAAVNAGADARNQLVMRNQGLVGKVARRYFDTGLAFEDLMQEGQIGLIKAADRYDPEQGTRFSTYAVWWIRQAVGRAVANTGRMIRLPVNLGQRVMQVRRTGHQLAQELGRHATPEEIAERLEWSLDRVVSVSEAAIPVMRLEELIGPNDSKDTELQELLADDNSLQPEEEATVILMLNDISKALSVLAAREEAVLKMRYGFVDGRMHPLSELARKFGLSREGMRQLTNRALEKVRRSPDSQALREYLTAIE